MKRESRALKSLEQTNHNTGVSTVRKPCWSVSEAHIARSTARGERTDLASLGVEVVVLKIADVGHAQRPKQIPAAIVDRGTLQPLCLVKVAVHEPHPQRNALRHAAAGVVARHAQAGGQSAGIVI